MYKVNCCGADDEVCYVFAHVNESSRLLSGCIENCDPDIDIVTPVVEATEAAVIWSINKINDGCFSPMSTVIEQTKGKMFIKDLKFGDSVLAANQVFQPFVLDVHSHPSMSAEFIQVHTELSDNDPEAAPIELSPGHMIFIDGKDLPVRAGEVKVSDSLVGTSGPTKVTKINTVTRGGMFDPLTADGKSYAFLVDDFKFHTYFMALSLFV